MTFAVIVLISPLLLKLCAFPKIRFVVYGASVVFYGIGYYLRFELYRTEWLLALLGKLGMTLFEYLTGVAFFQFNAMQYISACRKYLQKSILRTTLGVITCLIIFFAILFGHTLLIGNIIVAPLIGLCFIVMFPLLKKPTCTQYIYQSILPICGLCICSFMKSRSTTWFTLPGIPCLSFFL